MANRVFDQQSDQVRLAGFVDPLLARLRLTLQRLHLRNNRVGPIFENEAVHRRYVAVGVGIIFVPGYTAGHGSDVANGDAVIGRAGKLRDILGHGVIEAFDKPVSHRRTQQR